jgi:NADPH:quinone reductase-like Zn-dependent oxidoreductase
MSNNEFRFGFFNIRYSLFVIRYSMFGVRYSTFKTLNLDKMKASYIENYGDFDNLITGDLERPEPGEGEVLVRIKAAGVNPVDAAIVRGMLKDFIPGEFPLIPGWDMAGVVESRGHAARRFREGDEVYGYVRRPKIQHGSFAQYMALPESYLAIRPQKLSMEESGGIPLVGLTAYQSLFEAGTLSKDDTLLILGASGGVGTLAVQLAKTVGANVIAVASKANHDYMKGLGADETVDYNENHLGKAVSEIMPDGVDMIFHCSRGDSLNQSIETLKPDGRLVSITNRQPDIRNDIKFEYVFVEPNALQLQHIQQLTDEGNITLPELKTFELEDTAKALNQIETLHTKGKLVITP